MLELSRIVEPKNSQPTLELALGCRSDRPHKEPPVPLELAWGCRTVEVTTQEAASALGTGQMHVLRPNTLSLCYEHATEEGPVSC